MWHWIHIHIIHMHIYTELIGYLKDFMPNNNEVSLFVVPSSGLQCERWIDTLDVEWLDFWTTKFSLFMFFLFFINLVWYLFCYRDTDCILYTNYEPKPISSLGTKIQSTKQNPTSPPVSLSLLSKCRHLEKAQANPCPIHRIRPPSHPNRPKQTLRIIKKNHFKDGYCSCSCMERKGTQN